MSKNYGKALEDLDLFLADTEGQTTEEIAKNLKDQGVDVEEFLRKVKNVIVKGRRFEREYLDRCNSAISTSWD